MPERINHGIDPYRGFNVRWISDPAAGHLCPETRHYDPLSQALFFYFFFFFFFSAYNPADGPATTTMDRRLSPSAKSSSPILSRPENSGPSGCPRSASTSPNSNRRTNVTTTTTPSSLPPASISGLTLSPLLGSTLMGGPRVTARRSWSPQHQSSLEVPTPRQIQSARNSLAATGCSVNQQNSIEV